MEIKMKIFEGEMLIKIQHTTLLQIVCEFVINSNIIFKNIMGQHLSRNREGLQTWKG